MYRFALTRHCGLDPQSAEHYEIPRQVRHSNLFAWLAKNDENHKIYTLLLIPQFLSVFLKTLVLLQLQIYEILLNCNSFFAK